MLIWTGAGQHGKVESWQTQLHEAKCHLVKKVRLCEWCRVVHA